MPQPSNALSPTQPKPSLPSLPLSIAQRVCRECECPVSALNAIYHSRKHSAREMLAAEFLAEVKLITLRLSTTYCAAEVQAGKTPKEVFEACAHLMHTQFAGIGTNEIEEAFSLAAARRIQADLTAYGGKFSVAMFGAVLAAYEDFRRPVAFALDKAQAEPAEAEPMRLSAGQAEPDKPAYTVAGHIEELRKANSEFEKWQDVPVWFAQRARELGMFDAIETDVKKALWVDCKRLAVQSVPARMQKAADQLDRAEHKRLSFIQDKIESDPETLPTELNAETVEVYQQRLTFALLAPYQPE